MCLPIDCKPSDFQECADKLLKPVKFIDVEFQDGSCQNGDLPTIDRYDIMTMWVFHCSQYQNEI